MIPRSKNAPSSPSSLPLLVLMFVGAATAPWWRYRLAVEGLSSGAAVFQRSSAPSQAGATADAAAAATTTTTPATAAAADDIEMPDFDELFGRIQRVSPLARLVVSGGREGAAGAAAAGRKGFDAIMKGDDRQDQLGWKTVESNRREGALIRQIERIDNYNGVDAPLMRFRSSMKGPCIGECFARFIMDLDERKKWDTQIEQVYEAYPMRDLDAANIAMGFGRYGDCNRMGIGYCQTKAGFGISPREQLTLCGVQDFADGSCLIWGVEMEERHDSLLPPGPRHTRARTHVFSTTLTPTGDDSFDVEYVLQLEVGGMLPSWLTTPVVTDSVKRLFKAASDFYLGRDGDRSLDRFLELKVDEFEENHSLLMTP